MTDTTDEPVSIMTAAKTASFAELPPRTIAFSTQAVSRLDVEGLERIAAVAYLTAIWQRFVRLWHVTGAAI
jgi:hypothetical protein